MILEFAVAALLSCDARLTALFAPIRPEIGRYEVCTEAAALDAVVASAVAAGAHASSVELSDAAAAFGNVGLHDRGALARLYGGRRVRVVHAWRESRGRFESITFISPYPDAALTALNDGTLIRTLTINPPR